MSDKMTKEAAARIQSAGDRNPSSDTKESGFDRRAQSAADQAVNQGKGQGGSSQHGGIGTQGTGGK